mmetsp:Transcript_20550/g.39065  ORF Transcript_20550/g.39065 Transcript_20550/m.39065 type:complete len:211 (+) Transcript_20550:953-1585(+)
MAEKLLQACHITNVLPWVIASGCIGRFTHFRSFACLHHTGRLRELRWNSAPACTFQGTIVLIANLRFPCFILLYSSRRFLTHSRSQGPSLQTLQDLARVLDRHVSSLSVLDGSLESFLVLRHNCRADAASRHLPSSEVVSHDFCFVKHLAQHSIPVEGLQISTVHAMQNLTERCQIFAMHGSRHLSLRTCNYGLHQGRLLLHLLQGRGFL